MDPLELPDKLVYMSDKQHDWQIEHSSGLKNKDQCIKSVEPSVKPVCTKDNVYDWQSMHNDT